MKHKVRQPNQLPVERRNEPRQWVHPHENPPIVNVVPVKSKDDDDNGDIPLPPLPAASDKDPEAMLDTRPAKEPTPPPVKEKTEMEMMIEKHEGGAEVPAPAVHEEPRLDQAAADAAAAAAAAAYVVPANIELPETEPPAPAEARSKFDEAPPGVDMDELAMLGIDPGDFAGFGKR